MEYKQGDLDITDMRKNPKIIDWSNTCKYHKLTEAEIEEFKQYIDWKNISKYQNLSEEFIKKNDHFFYWRYLSHTNTIFTYNFLIEYCNDYRINKYFKHPRPYSFELLRQLKNHINNELMVDILKYVLPINKLIGRYKDKNFKLIIEI